MNLASHARKAARPDKAVRYFTSGGGTTNWEPALLWLVLLCIGLNVLRTGQFPNGPQAATWVGLAALVVLAGAFVPEAVAVVLVGLLVASALNLNNKLTAAVDAATAKVGQAIAPGVQ
jgi:hypothetical protein